MIMAYKQWSPNRCHLAFRQSFSSCVLMGSTYPWDLSERFWMRWMLHQDGNSFIKCINLQTFSPLSPKLLKMLGKVTTIHSPKMVPCWWFTMVQSAKNNHHITNPRFRATFFSHTHLSFVFVTVNKKRKISASFDHQISGLELGSWWKLQKKQLPRRRPGCKVG